MESSLRSRIWWGYALIIMSALSVVAVILLVYIIQNPSTYRQASTRLTIVAALIRKHETEWVNFSTEDIQTQLEKIDNSYDTRIALYDARHQLIADSRIAQQPALSMPRFPRLRPYSILQDSNGKSWLYMLLQLKDGRWLLLGVPRPAIPLSAFLSDEFLLPIIGSAIVALIISLLAAFWMARWIGNPLQEIVAASHRMPSTEMKAIPLSGPREVKELSQAFNEMTTRVYVNQKSQREFVANVSHELKTPLTSIQGFAQAILDGTASTPDSQKQAAQVIYDESGRMHRLVLNLLDLARMDAGTFDLIQAPLDINTLLKNVAEKFEPQARQMGVTIQVEEKALSSILGDGDRLAQVFTNLIDNALKFIPAGGKIRLTTMQEGNSIEVSVSDNGAGIPPEVLPQIFNRFYQADPSRRGGKKHGAGLGLAIAHEIVQAHGGTINVRSTQGEGSIFTVHLPLPKAEAGTLASQRRKNQR